jgi:tetratricopeptide (TPR) repeat protein
MKNYEEAKISFMTVCENHPDNIASKFFLGIVEIELGDFNGALGYFNQVIKSKDQFYTEQSEWHRALCLIKLDLKQEATKQLNTIIEQKGFYVKKAEEIISMLE